MEMGVGLEVKALCRIVELFYSHLLQANHDFMILALCKEAVSYWNRFMEQHTKTSCTVMSSGKPLFQWLQPILKSQQICIHNSACNSINCALVLSGIHSATIFLPSEGKTLQSIPPPPGLITHHWTLLTGLLTVLSKTESKGFMWWIKSGIRKYHVF